MANRTMRGARVPYPVFAGSARTGAGVDALTAGIAELLPAAEGDGDGPASGTVFKIERGPAGEKVAYVRMFAGELRTRARLEAGKVTAISVFEGGEYVRRDAIGAGEIGKLWGLPGARIGDAVGAPPAVAAADRAFAPPTLESVVIPRRAGDRRALHLALTQLAEQDPLIGLRLDELRQEISLSLYWARQSHSHVSFDKSMSSTARDFRQLTPLVLMDALRRAGTRVAEPLHRFRLELPADALGAVRPAVAQLGGVPHAPRLWGAECELTGEIAAARVHELRRQLPGLTRGEAVVETAFDRNEPVRGAPPSRPWAGELDPRDRDDYIRRLTSRRGR